MEEGNSWETYDPVPAIKKWNIGKVRNATEEKGPCSYKSRNSTEANVKSESDDDSYDEEDNISENGDE